MKNPFDQNPRRRRELPSSYMLRRHGPDRFPRMPMSNRRRLHDLSRRFMWRGYGRHVHVRTGTSSEAVVSGAGSVASLPPLASLLCGSCLSSELSRPPESSLPLESSLPPGPSHPPESSLFFESSLPSESTLPSELRRPPESSLSFKSSLPSEPNLSSKSSLLSGPNLLPQDLGDDVFAALDVIPRQRKIVPDSKPALPYKVLLENSQNVATHVTLVTPSKGGFANTLYQHPSHPNLRILIDKPLPRIRKRKDDAFEDVVFDTSGNQMQLVFYHTRCHLLLYGTRLFTPWILKQVFGQDIEPNSYKWSAWVRKIAEIIAGWKSLLMTASEDWIIALLESQTSRNPTTGEIIIESPLATASCKDTIAAALLREYSPENFLSIWAFVKGNINIDADSATTELGHHFCKSLFVNLGLINWDIAVMRYRSARAVTRSAKLVAREHFAQMFAAPDLDGTDMDDFERIQGCHARVKRRPCPVKTKFDARDFVCIGPRPPKIAKRCVESETGRVAQIPRLT